MKKITLSMLMVSLLAACASAPKQDANPAGDKKDKPAAKVDTPAKTDAVALDPLKDPKNILSKRSIYYDFDKSVVKDEFKPLVKAHSAYLSSHPEAKTTLQGNCDERGSREYNLALGQRRADSVKQLMTASGVSDKQIETVSFGEEKPKAEGHNEEAWAQNRRTDIVYKGE